MAFRYAVLLTSRALSRIVLENLFAGNSLTDFWLCNFLNFNYFQLKYDHIH